MNISTEIHDLMIEIQGGHVELRDDRMNQKWIVDPEAFMIPKFMARTVFLGEVVSFLAEAIKACLLEDYKIIR